MGCITISRNAGVEGPVVVEKLLASRNPHLGYNAQTGEYVDMVKAGIIDAAKVTKTALVDAASVASLLDLASVSAAPTNNDRTSNVVAAITVAPSFSPPTLPANTNFSE